MEKANLRMSKCCDTCKYCSLPPIIEGDCESVYLKRFCKKDISNNHFDFVWSHQICDLYEACMDEN